MVFWLEVWPLPNRQRRCGRKALDAATLSLPRMRERVPWYWSRVSITTKHPSMKEPFPVYPKGRLYLWIKAPWTKAFPAMRAFSLDAFLRIDQIPEFSQTGHLKSVVGTVCENLWPVQCWFFTFKTTPGLLNLLGNYCIGDFQTRSAWNNHAPSKDSLGAGTSMVRNHQTWWAGAILIIHVFSMP